jgi:hypothetical protein
MKTLLAAIALFTLTFSLVAQTPTPTPIPNAAPKVFVDGEPDYLGGGAFLCCSQIDDGLNRAVSFYWQKVSGPGTVSWSAQSGRQTRVRFSIKGLYVLKCTVSDGQYFVADQITVMADTAADIAVRP